jgi:hypothetical protein
MIDAIIFIGDHALFISVAFVAISGVVCLIVAWINRPFWLRRFEESLRRRFRGVI